jgi:hypothetical protein
MAERDDAANFLGIDIQMSSLSTGTRGQRDEKVKENVYKNSIDMHTALFQCKRICQSGTEANVWCYLHRCRSHHPDSVVFATGSYIAGDTSYMQQFSTSAFDVKERISTIISPCTWISAGIDKKIMNRIIALPYFIPCTHVNIDSDNFVNYEKQCLDQFHICCRIGKMHGKQILILSLELILAGNGAILTDRFLDQLANIANKHDVYFHIDKVFTAGRMEHSFLLTQSKPANFIASVSTLSMGKWTGVRPHLSMIILVNEEYPPQ